MTSAISVFVEKDLWTSAAACGKASPIVEPAKPDLDLVLAFVSTLVIFGRLFSQISLWDTGAYPFAFQRFCDSICVVSAI